MRSVVGAFCPGCLLDRDELLFFEFLDELLPRVLVAELEVFGFAEDFELLEACPKLPGTPSPARDDISSTRSAGRSIFMSFGSFYSLLKRRPEAPPLFIVR
jgi:hypothetical protein